MTGIMMAVLNSVQPTATMPTPTLYLDAFDYSGSGTTWTAENGSDATLVNTPTYTSPSPTYFSFAPASAEKATVPDLGDLNQWTVEAWFRVTSSLTGQVTAVVCNQFDGGNLNFSMGTNNAPSSYTISVGFFNGAWRTTTGFAPTLNTWYHCVGTYDGTTIRQYVNAVQDTTLSYSGTPVSGGEVRIASRWDSQSAPGDFFPGDIGLVRIWNSALTASQIQELYDQNVDRFSLTPTVTSFTTVETTSWTAPAGVSRVQYLVVAGGGGGGNGYDNGGGGGGGGGMALTDYLDVVPGTSYTVTVGDGGAGGVGLEPTYRTNANGATGSNSVFATITALGGGGGGGSRTGGSPGAAQISNTTAATGGNGNGGGLAGDGGGGATGAGTENTSTGGVGGTGLTSTITGSSVTYSAGGNGADNITSTGAAGGNNTGKGGGAGGGSSSAYGNGGKGGSGIVVVRYGS